MTLNKYHNLRLDSLILIFYDQEGQVSQSNVKNELEQDEVKNNQIIQSVKNGNIADPDPTNSQYNIQHLKQAEQSLQQVLNSQKEHLNNQSTDVDEIVPQFKSQQQAHLSSKLQEQSNLQKRQENLCHSSESDDQKLKALVQRKDQSNNPASEEQKQQQVMVKNGREIQSSSPSSTSSEDEQPQKISKSLQRDQFDSQNDEQARTNDQAQIRSSDQSNTNQREMNQRRPVSQRPSQSDLNEEQKQVQSQSESQQENVSSSDSNEDEEDEEEDDDEQPIQSETNIVVEESPKGRFKRFGEELGRGAYKIVYKGVDNETGREIAWNVINLNRLPKNDRVRIRSEIELIKKLEHQNIIHFISAWYYKQKDQVVFITEMITGGSLRKYVKKIKHPRLRVIKGWCIEILQGLVYLHEQKPHPIIHRDLKCDNIFINSNSGEIRIGDLGLSTPMQNSYTTSVLGTPEFMAPELYEECYGTSVDVYAFGMCVLEMITLERPYRECQNPAQIYQKVIQGIRPRALERIEDQEVKDFILWCLSSAETRPTARQLLDSRFLKDLESEKNTREVKVKPLVKQKGPKRKKSIQYKIQKHGSTILEEEEENSEDDKDDQQVKQMILEQSKIKQQIEQAQQKDNIQSSEASAQSIQSSVITQSQVQETQKDIPQSLPILSQQSQNQNEENKQQDQLVQEENKNQETLSVNQSQNNNNNKKQRKSGSKNKKLDESVVFLKQIDKEKQKKLQERTMRMEQNQDINGEQQQDSSSEEEEQNNGQCQANVLDELIKQDQEHEKQLLELQMQAKKKSIEQEQTTQDSQITQINLAQSQQQQKQLDQLPQNYYDSSDQNNKTPVNGNNNQQQSKVSVSLTSDPRKDKKDAATFAKNKAFKEDSTISKTNSQPQQNQKQLPIQPQKNIQSEQNRQASYQVVSSANEDFRKKEAQPQQEQPSQNYQQQNQAQQNVPITQQQQKHQTGYASQQNEQKRNQHLYQQNSDSHLSNNTQSKKGSMAQIKNPNYGSGIIDSANHQTDSVFDNQSSSSESSQNSVKDAEVDNIQMPKQQIEDSQLTSQTKPSTISEFHSSAYNIQMPFTATGLGRSSADVLSHNMKRTLPQSQNQIQSQSSQNILQVASQILPQTSVKQLPQSQPGIVKMPIVQTQSTDKQQRQVNQEQPQQKPKQTLIPEKQSSNQSLLSQPQQQPGSQTTKHQSQFKRQEENTINPTQSQFSKQQFPQVSQKQSLTQVDLSPATVIKSRNKINMSFKIKSFDGSPDKEVTFDFDTNTDTAAGVAQEMVRELMLPHSYIEIISKQIRTLIEKNQMQPIANKSQPDQTKKESPVKISKESAISLFTKLFDGIDNFFQIMQSKNIETTDEIIEAMEGSAEEQQMRLEFLNKVFQAKKQYKRGIEELRKKAELKKKQAQEAQQKQQSVVPQLQKSLTEKQVIPQSQLVGKQQQNSQQQQQHQKKSVNDDQLKRVGSNQDLILTSQQQQQHHQEKKEFPKNTVIVPSYVRKQFKVAPPQFNYPIKLNQTMKKVEHETCDEDVVALQNILNLIFEVSVCQLINNPQNSLETQQFVLNYIPLRLDGFFGEKTEQHVVRFQNHIKVNPDGVVSEQLWQILQNYIDHINKQEEQRFGQVQQQQQLTQKDPKIQAIQSQQKVSQQPIHQQYSRDRQVNPQQNMSQQTNQQNAQVLQNQRIPHQHQTHYNQSQGRQSSPSKHGALKKQYDLDYNQVIEQAFPKNDYDSQDLDNDQ